MKVWSRAMLTIGMLSFLLAACGNFDINPNPPTGTGSPFMVATVQALWPPAP